MEQYIKQRLREPVYCIQTMYKGVYMEKKEQIIYVNVKELKLNPKNPRKNDSEIVEIAREYIKQIGGFEKFAEWGLF